MAHDCPEAIQVAVIRHGANQAHWSEACGAGGEDRLLFGVNVDLWIGHETAIEREVLAAEQHGVDPGMRLGDRIDREKRVRRLDHRH